MICSKQFVITFFFVAILTTQTIPADVQKEDAEKWANELAKEIVKLQDILQVEKFTPTELTKRYEAKDYDATSAEQELKGVVGEIETLMTGKANLAKKLQIAAEKKTKENNATCDNYYYYRAKMLSSNESNAKPTGENQCQKSVYLPLNADSSLNFMMISKSNTTAHVPTNVYDGSKTIMMVAKWTNLMEEDFTSNAKGDKGLKWQFFGSKEGFLRIYPGVKWYVQIGVSNPVDFYDCRSLAWYIMAATYPKDIIILVDKSGSMTGKREIIANRTVSEIIVSLTENDFFNVIQMNSPKSKITVTHMTHFVDPNYTNETIQATLRNKHRIIDALTLKPSGQANYTNGLIAAFTMLKNSKRTNKAIIILSDEAPDSYDSIFAKYNEDKSVRVFSFLIGKQATAVKDLKKMACNNRGYFSHIMTLSDVKENILKYLPVMARASKDSPQSFTVWTGVHTSQILGLASHDHPAETTSSNATTNATTPEVVTPVKPNILKLYTTVSRVAYNMTNTTSLSYSQILGVAGIEVPMSHIEGKAHQWRVGVFGYYFMTNNNGYVLFHPNFRPTYKKNMKPYFQNTDIADVEHPNDAAMINGLADVSTFKLRKSLIDREKTNMMLPVYSVPDDFKSVLNMTMNYFVMPVQDTSYSVGLALRWQGAKSEKYINPKSKLSGIKSDAQLGTDYADSMEKGCDKDVLKENYGVLIPSYEFCDFVGQVADDFEHNPTCALREVLRNATLRNDLKCDNDFLSRIQADAEESRHLNSSWRGKDWTTFGIDQVFMIFYSGLTRYMYTNRTLLRDQYFISNHTKGLRDPLFQTIFVFGELAGRTDSVYFHAPAIEEVATKTNVDANTSVSLSVTATSMVYFSEKPQVPYAVAGAQLDYTTLKSIFIQKISTCTGDKCVDGNSTDVDSYLITTNGFIVVSKNNDSEVGRSLADVHPDIMESMVKSAFFSSEVVYDFQGLCPYNRTVKSVASRLIDPLTAIVRGLAAMAWSVTLYIVHLAVTLFWAAVSIAEENPYYNVSSKPPWNSCGYKHTVYTVNFKKNFMTGKLPKADCSSCEKSWTAKTIDKTNLILLIVSQLRKNCSCNVTASPSEERLKVNRSILVEVYRKDYPVPKSTTHSPKDEGKQSGTQDLHCSSYHLAPPILLVIVLVVTQSINGLR